MRNRLENKGVYTRNNKKGPSYEAYVTVKSAGSRSTKTFKAHVGTYPTLEQAVTARINFITNLK
jgi:hypothetical protein